MGSVVLVSNGFYDVQDPDQTPPNMRGVFTTGVDGAYEIGGPPTCSLLSQLQGTRQ